MRHLYLWLSSVVSILVIMASCGGNGGVNSAASGTTGTGGGATSTASTTASTTSATTSTTGGTGGAQPDGGLDGGMCTITDQPFGAAAIAGASCSSPPPAGAPKPPPPKAYTGGTCPKLIAYAGTTATENTLMSMGNARNFALAVPANLQPDEVLPVIFLWHWLKGSDQDFYATGDVQNAVDNQRFLAVIPVEKGDQKIIPGVNLDLVWPYAVTVTQARQEEEYTFFDDMLSCVAEQFNVNTSCVSTVGVSAGALWTDQLVGARSEYLSSFLSLSGGVGGAFIKPYASPPPARAVPGMILWGGPTDNCIIINFQQCSQTLEMNMTANCNFVVECIHNCGHGVPPFDFDAGSSDFAGLWQFAFDHPYWLPQGTSPYTTKGLPATLPEWCAIGVGNATPRTGACNPPGC